MDFYEIGTTLMDVEWLHAPSDHYSVNCPASSGEEAEKFAIKATQMGLMAHIESYGFEDWPAYEVFLATPKWVDSYYSNGGRWGFHWYKPEVEGWFGEGSE